MSETVVVAGAGPAGLMLACELGRLGVPTVVLDPLTEVSDRSPGQGLNTSCVELLEQRGMLDGLVEQGAPLQGTHFSLFWLDMTPLEGRNQRGLLLGQERLERHLEARARAFGVDLRRGHAFVSCAADDDGVTVTVATAGPIGEYDLRAAYLVGADGERSAVRAQAGVGFPGHGQPCYGLVGDVEADVAELAEIHVGARFSPVGGLYSAAPSGAGLLRVVTAEFGRDLPSDDSPPDLAELMASVQRLNGSSFAARGVRWLRRYGGPTRVADVYRAGRVFLVGDAAHTFFPLAALRLNTCLDDAVNLGWKLAADLGGWASAGLLDSYGAERRPVGVRSGAVTDAQLALIHPVGTVAPLRTLFGELLKFPDVNGYFLDVVTGLEVSYPMAGDPPASPLVGKRLPHVPLSTTAGPTTVPRLLESGQGLLLTFDDKAESAPGPVPWPGRVIAATASTVPSIEAAAVLVRPDGHVAWVQPVDTPVDRDALVRAGTPWFGAAA